MTSHTAAPDERRLAEQALAVNGGAQGPIRPDARRESGMVDTLRAMPLFEELSEEQLAWLAVRGDVVWLDGGGCVFSEGDPNTAFFALIEGELQITKIVGGHETRSAASLFILIGALPRTDWLQGVFERDRRGFILAGPDLKRDGRPAKGWNLDRDPFLLETSVPGVFVAGDVMAGSVKRVASGVGAGSIAVQFIHQYLANVR